MKFKKNQPLAPFTTFKIGGPADYFVIVKNEVDLIKAYKWGGSRSLPVLVLGKGSNVLISDKGWRGLVVVNQANQVKFKNHKLEAESGIVLMSLVKKSVSKNLSGLHYFAGIPGSLGGAIYNNAHFLDWLIGDLVVWVRVLDSRGKVKKIPQKDCEFAYEQSRFQETEELILSAQFKLKPALRPNLEKKLSKVLSLRQKKHPSGPSAGSIFQNPKHGPSAGELIDKSGLKATQVGGAQVSEKHANFIINTGNAKAQDVLDLISLIQERVIDNFGVDLQPEIFFKGER